MHPNSDPKEKAWAEDGPAEQVPGDEKIGLGEDIVQEAPRSPCSAVSIACLILYEWKFITDTILHRALEPAASIANLAAWK